MRKLWNSCCCRKILFFYFCKIISMFKERENNWRTNGQYFSCFFCQILSYNNPYVKSLAKIIFFHDFFEENNFLKYKNPPKKITRLIARSYISNVFLYHLHYCMCFFFFIFCFSFTFFLFFVGVCVCMCVKIFLKNN